MLDDRRLDVHTLQARRRATLARPRRVNQALSRWDEYRAAAAMPAELRPPVRESAVLS
jgi:hypothetical protein